MQRPVGRIIGSCAAISDNLDVFLEFVPALQKSLAYGWMFILAFAASVMRHRTKRFPSALRLAMAVPILGGFPFVYLGVYMGGTLPFSEPGPSLQELFRQYLPFLAMVLTIALGPQLTVKLRIVGHDSSKAGGKISYRLALGGILLGLVLTLLQSAIISSGLNILLTVRQVMLVAAVALYLAGFALLVRAAKYSILLSSDNSNVLQLAALFIPLLCVPIVILLAIPIGMGSYSRSWLLPLAVIAWVIAAVWMVKD